MTSSGTYNYSLSDGDGVLAAYERIQIRGASIRAEHMTTARREINLLFVELSNRQVNLWTVEQTSTTLIAGQSTYGAASRVVMILDAWITTGSGTSATDRYVTPISRTEYATLSNKQIQGAPTQYWFQRGVLPNDLFQNVTMWPVPDSGGPYTLKYYFCSQLQDANLPGGETPNLPYLWLDVMISGLAYRLSRIYKPELETVRKQDYSDAWTIAATQGVENVNMNIMPQISTYYRR